MQTSGHGNDALMILVPGGVLIAIGVILFGGPVEALQAINTLVADTARAAVQMVSALFS